MAGGASRTAGAPLNLRLADSSADSRTNLSASAAVQLFLITILHTGTSCFGSLTRLQGLPALMTAAFALLFLIGQLRRYLQEGFDGFAARGPFFLCVLSTPRPKRKGDKHSTGCHGVYMCAARGHTQQDCASVTLLGRAVLTLAHKLKVHRRARGEAQAQLNTTLASHAPAQPCAGAYTAARGLHSIQITNCQQLLISGRQLTHCRSLRRRGCRCRSLSCCQRHCRSLSCRRSLEPQDDDGHVIGAAQLLRSGRLRKREMWSAVRCAGEVAREGAAARFSPNETRLTSFSIPWPPSAGNAAHRQ